MFVYIQGIILHKEKNSFIVVTQGIGYSVFVPEMTFERYANGQSIELYLYHVVRETAEELYGFHTREELTFFEQLLSVSGVGPKTALSVMALSSLDKMKAAISRGDAGLLKTVSGIGSKTAERIVVELKNKIGYVGLFQGGDNEKDLIDALVQLGYSQQDARDALRALPVDVENEQERLKAALKLLGTHK